VSDRPRRLRVGPFLWQVKWSQIEVLRYAPAGDACGTTHHPDLVIAIQPGRAEDYNRSILLHELLHACARAADLQAPEDTEETVVAALTGPLLQALRDNPALLEYLTGPS